MGLVETVFNKSRKIFTKALKGGVCLTRTELAGALEKAGIKASGFHLAYIVMRAELDGVVCSGALRGKQQTYALLEERVPLTRTLDREEGLVELTRRYFNSRGPATMKDYLIWSSLTAAEGRRGLDSIKSELQNALVDGRTYWFARSSGHTKSAPPVFDLVQGYDEYIMSYSESRDLLRPHGNANVPPSSESAFLHVVLLDGRVIGRWRHALTKDQVVVEARFDRALSRLEAQALESAVERYGRYMGLPAVPKTA